MMRSASISSLLVSTLLLCAPAGAQSLTGGVPLQDEDAEEKSPDADEADDRALSGMLIVLNKAEASASILDLSTGEEVAKVPVGDGPHEVAVSPDGRTAVVCNYGSRTSGNTLTVIDLVTFRPKSTIDLGEHHRPHGIVYLPDGARVVVTAEQEQHLLIVDVRSGEVVKAMPTLASVSHMVALSPDAKRAFVANIGSDSMTAFDLESGERLAEVATGAEAEGIDVSPDGREVWVSNRRNNTITVVDAATLEVIEHIDCPSFPIRLKFTPDGSRVLVSNARSGDVAIFDAATREEIHRIAMDEEAVEDTEGRLFSGAFPEGSPVPVGILILPEGRHVFIANTQADVVTVLDLEQMRIVGRLRAGKEPDGLAYTPLKAPPKPTPPSIGK